MLHSIQGLLVGDKGYLPAPRQHELRPLGSQLEAALRSSMHDSRPPMWVALRLWRLIETVMGQLVERFSIEKV